MDLPDDVRLSLVLARGEADLAIEWFSAANDPPAEVMLLRIIDTRLSVMNRRGYECVRISQELVNGITGLKMAGFKPDRLRHAMAMLATYVRGKLCLDLNDPQMAVANFHNALAIAGLLASEDNWTVKATKSQTIEDLGVALYQIGECDEAVDRLEQAQDFWNRNYGSQSGFTAYNLMHIGNVRVSQNRLSEAEFSYSEAVAIFDEIRREYYDLPPDADEALVREAYAAFLMRAGQNEMARRQISKADAIWKLYEAELGR